MPNDAAGESRRTSGSILTDPDISYAQGAADWGWSFLPIGTGIIPSIFNAPDIFYSAGYGGWGLTLPNVSAINPACCAAAPAAAAGAGSGATGSNAAAGPATAAGGGLVINVTYDQNQSSLPAGFVAAVNYVVNYYESVFTDPVTINIDIGYGEIAGQSLGSGALGESETYIDPVDYSQAVAALKANGPSAAQQSAYATLPASSPLSGGTLWLATAQEKALGLLPANDTDIDGYVGFSSVYPFSYSPTATPGANQYYFVGVVAHELSEVMGRDSFLGDGINGTTSYSIMDLFRYSAPGQRALSASSGTAFFSVNSGTTDLDNWNTNPGGDLGDWAASAGNDAYLAFSPSGQIDSVSPTDIELMNVLGWNPPNVAYVSSGQKTSGIVLSSGDILVVLSGGTTIGVIVSSGGTENVSSGGTANGTQVLNGGTLAVASGAAASGTTASGGGEYVASGGVVSATTLVGGGFDVVSGNAVGTIVNSGGTDTDYGVESATTVNGGLQVVQSGGTAIGTAVNAGSEEYVASAGTVSSSKLNGGFDIVFGTAVSTTVDSGSNDYDYGVERGTIINNGIQFVESGALASGTTVSGGEEYVFAGGTVSGTKLAGGFAVLFGRAVSTTITSNSNDYDLGVESGTTIINGIQFVESGAAASGTTVSGGEEYVFSGGTVSGTKLAGGFDIIFGRAVGTTISAASNDYDYGVESGTTILSGIQFVESGASASGTTVSGGEEYVFSGGTVSGTKLAGSFDVVFGVAVGTTMTGSGNDYDYGVESGTTVSSGVQVVESGGSASGTMVSAGGQEYVVAGGTVTGTTLNGGAGVLFGTAVSTIIAGGSIDYDYGVESGTTVSSGLQVVEAGAAASGTTVLSGGEEFVVAGGTVSGSKLNGGFDVLFGTAIGATLNSGGRDYVQSGGTDSAATVNNGGLQVVSAGGIARGDFVHSGGTEYIASGGFASGTTISGGVVEVASNAVTSGSLFTFALSGGGTLQLDDSQHFASTGLVAGFGPPKSTERIDFSDIPFVSGATTVNYTSGDAGNTSGTLIVSGGGHTASIELLGQYMAQQFQVTSDGHSGTLVTDPPVSSSSTMASLTTASPHH